jgi:uncharacterized protein YbjT (DUF2867 family)
MSEPTNFALHPVPVSVDIAGNMRYVWAYAVVQVIGGDVDDPAFVLVRVLEGAGDYWHPGQMRTVLWTKLLTLDEATARLHRSSE